MLAPTIAVVGRRTRLEGREVSLETCVRWLIRGARRRRFGLTAQFEAEKLHATLESGDRLPAGWVLLTLRSPRALTLRIATVGGAYEKPLTPNVQTLLRMPDQITNFSLSLEIGGGAFAAEVVFQEVTRFEALARIVAKDRGAVSPDRRDKRALEAFIAPYTPVRADPYADWIREYDSPSADDLARMAVGRENAPMISVLTPVYNTPPEYLRAMIASVRAQNYPNWELCLVDDASPDPATRDILAAEAASDPRVRTVFREQNGHISAASNTAIEMARGAYYAFVDHDDLLAKHALATMAQAIDAAPNSDILYSDEDRIDGAGVRRDPFFKPDWSPERLLAQNYLNHLTMLRADLVKRIGGLRLGYEGSQDHDLLLRASRATKGPIVHVPHILYHWRQFEGGWTYSNTQMAKAMAIARRAVEEHLASRGVVAEVLDLDIGIYRIKRAPPSAWPSVTVIIPTRDHVDILARVVKGLFEKTDYGPLDLIIADNDSADSAAQAYLQDVAKLPNVRVLPAPGAFNFSRINNLAAAEATGDILLLLNNDVSMIEPGWLKELICLAMAPDVGAVGARLLYPDGTLQHGGIVMGIENFAGHVHKGARRDDPGYFGRLRMAQEVGGVTGACLAIRRDVWKELGGLNETNVAIAGNDVDLCLRLRERGYRILWTPHAELFHWESKSRGLDETGDKRARLAREIAWLREHWGDRLLSDPYWNPNLSPTNEWPEIAFPPRVARPWGK